MAEENLNTVPTLTKQEDFERFPSNFANPIYTQEKMNNFNIQFGDLADATLAQALENRVVRDVIRKNNLDPNDLSVATLRDGTAPILNTFNFRNTKTGEIVSGSQLTPEAKANIFKNEGDIFEYFARGPTGEKITEGKYGEGMKSRIIPGVSSFPRFYAGATATNYALSGVAPVTPWTAAIRVGGPIIGGLLSTILTEKPAQSANDFVFGEADVYLPDQAGKFKFGQALMDYSSWFAAPYLFKGNLGSNLITNFAEQKRVGPRFIGAVERSLAGVQTEARTAPIRTGLVELGAAYGGAKAIELGSDAEGAFAEFFIESLGATAVGVGTDIALKRAVPGAISMFKGAKKLFNKGFRKDVVNKASKTLGNQRKAELAVYALEMISTVEDPQEIYRRLKWYTTSRDAVRAGREIPKDPSKEIIPAKGKEGEKNYVPAVTEADLFAEFGDIITETIDPKTGEMVELPTALAGNSLGFMLLQQSNTGQSASPSMQRSINKLGTKAQQAHDEFRGIMQNMILAGFASEDKELIGVAGELASLVFAKDMEEDLAAAVLKYTDARKQLLQSDNEADLLKASQDLQGMILKRLKSARNNEKRLWAEVPEYNINIGDFRNGRGALNTITLPNGKVVNAPNFVSTWFSMLPSDPKDRTSFLKDPQYKDINDYVTATLEELGYDLNDSLDVAEDPLALAKSVFGDSPSVSLDGSISSKTLTFRRSKLLNEARVASGQQDNQKANFLNKMANSFLQDLESFPGNVGDNTGKYDLARAYSAALNSSFTKPFVGKITAKDRTGSYRIAPESVIDSVFSSTFASERARAIDALGQFEIAQELTTLLNLSPIEASQARDDFLGALSQLPDNLQRDYSQFAEDLNTVEVPAAIRTIQGRLANDSLPAQERVVLEQLLTLQESTGLGIGQNLESEQAGALLNQIRMQAFDTTSGFIDLPKLKEVLAANDALLNDAPKLKEALYNSLNQSTTTRGVMETALRKFRDFGFDSEGNFSQRTLERWMDTSEAKGLIQAFPDMKKDLDLIIQTNGEHLKVIENNKARMRNAKDEQDWFYLLKKEGDEFVAPEDMSLPFETLFSNTQTKPGALLEKFWRVAKNAPAEQTLEDGTVITKEAAKRGFKSALVNSVLNQAGLKSDGQFSAIKAFELFFKPMPRSDNKITLAEWAVKNGAMTQPEVTRMKKLLTRIGEIDMLAASGQSLSADELSQKLGTSVELLASALGSATASKLYRAVGGDAGGTGSLAVVTRGSTAAVNQAREIMTSMPAALKADFFLDVLENPDLAIDLLETGQSKLQMDGIAKDVVNYMISRGFIYSKGALPYVPDYMTSESLSDLYSSKRTEQEKARDVLDKIKSGEGKSKIQIMPKDPNLNPFTAPIRTNEEEASLIPPTVTPTNRQAVDPRRAAAPAPIVPNNVSQPATQSRYAALFPNDTISSMIKNKEGIGSLI
jgi:hypothetical protein